MSESQSQRDAIEAEIFTQEPGDSLAVQGNERSGALAEFFGSSMSLSCHNFKGDSRQMLAFTSKATTPGALKFADVPADGVDVEYIYCHLVPIAGKESGEFSECTRTVLFTPTGERYQFVSNGIAAGACSIFKALGFDKFTPPLRVKVTSHEMGKGRKMYSLDPV